MIYGFLSFFLFGHHIVGHSHVGPFGHKRGGGRRKTYINLLCYNLQTHVSINAEIDF